MKKYLILLVAVIFCSLSAHAQMTGPFDVSAELISAKDELLLNVTFSIPEGTYLYRKNMTVKLEGQGKLIEKNLPPATNKFDPVFEEEVTVHLKDVTFVYTLDSVSEYPVKVTVGYMGCRDKQCFMPGTKSFELEKGAATAVKTVEQPKPPEKSVAQAEPGEYRMIGRAAGYLDAEEFIAFLDNAEAGEGMMSSGKLKDLLARRGVFVLVLIVILAGLGLNLTPCILPMIPVNLAIIGAGAQSGSKARGFILGGVYGLGIAAAYGLLGLLFVLGGTRFGTLNASPFFNIAIGIVFLVLSLAMFGVFNLDFTRFQGRVSAGETKGSFATAFILGVIAALLAGACVAPLVISTLVLALDLYSKGNGIALVLPFLLGLGMALPWPFAGAGLSFLPKAGMWMEKVKYTFGVIIILAAAYYTFQGVKLYINQSEGMRAKVVAAQTGSGDEWLTSIEEAIEVADKEGKPVFVDFWASWCGACLKMEKTTFKDPAVLARLENYVKVKFRAEDQSKPEIKAVLDKYIEAGLPTYVILQK